MTNWLITQTTRFKAAVTGAGAVENVANWGNDDTTFDDAYFLGGLPWEAPDRYRSEAAIFQIDKVRTPTHMVAGADDIRVAVLEDYLLDRALHELNIPSDLLIFPGEGHDLDKESLARKNQSPRRTEVAGEVWWRDGRELARVERGKPRPHASWAFALTGARRPFAVGQLSRAEKIADSGRCPDKELRRFAGDKPRSAGCARPRDC